MSDTLYTRLSWAVQGFGGRPGQKELRPYLEQFGQFFVDYCWAIPDQAGPTDRLIRAMDALLRMEASGKGWTSTEAKEHLAVALEEIEKWSVSLR